MDWSGGPNRWRRQPAARAANIYYTWPGGLTYSTALTILLGTGHPNPLNGVTTPTDTDIATGTNSLTEMAFAVVLDKSLTSITDSNGNTELQRQSSEYVGLDGTPITGLTTTVTTAR